MVLTGKQALDYSGGVSAEDNFGIGGYERIMGPNGQAQYWAPGPRRRLPRAARPLRARLRRARRALPAPRRDRRPARSRRRRRCRTRSGSAARPRRRHLLRRDEPRPQEGLRHPLGDARDDRPGPPAAGALGGDARRRDRRRLGRAPRRLAGGAARHRVAAARRAAGQVPADGPTQWTSGTLFPRSSKKIARAINAVGGRRPVVVLANLAGLRRLAGVDAGVAARVRRRDRARGGQLRRADRLLRDLALPRRRLRGLLAAAQREPRGGRARGRSRVGDRRRPGGGGRLRPRGQAVDASAIRGSSRSTSGSPQPRAPERTRLRAERSELWEQVHAEKQGELAAEFDSVHSVERAVEMGSVSSHHPAGRAAPLPDRGDRAAGCERISGEGRRAMTELGWLTRELADVPSARSLAERAASARCSRRFESPSAAPTGGSGAGRRRRRWRRGAGWPLRAVEIAAAEDGAPEALIDGAGGPSRSRSAIARGGRWRPWRDAPSGTRLRSRGDRASQRGVRPRVACAPPSASWSSGQTGEAPRPGGEPDLDREGGRLEGTARGPAAERPASDRRGRRPGSTGSVVGSARDQLGGRPDRARLVAPGRGMGDDGDERPRFRGAAQRALLVGSERCFEREIRTGCAGGPRRRCTRRRVRTPLAAWSC